MQEPLNIFLLSFMHCHTAGDILARISGFGFILVSVRCSKGFLLSLIALQKGKLICPLFMIGGGRILRQSYGTAQPAHIRCVGAALFFCNFLSNFGNDSYEFIPGGHCV